MRIIKDKLNISLPVKLFSSKDESGLNKNNFKILVAILVLLSIGFWLFYESQGLTLAYNDARSRLNIARRIVDNLQPGFAQIGSVWLPLFHLLELPLVWNYSLWQSGFAGSLISMVSYVLGGVYFLKLMEKMDLKRSIIIIAFSVYAINPNMLFMQSLSMTESLLIFMAIASCYYLYVWSESLKPNDLVKAAFFILMSSLTRYDGWFLLLFASLFVLYVTLKRKKISFTVGTLILFLSLASLGVVLWLVWNKAIFGDFFYFALGPYSAKNQQDVLLSEGRLFSKGSFVYSLFLYLITIFYNTGIWIGILAVFGSFIFFFNKKISTNKKLILVLLSVPFIFNVFSLYMGHSVIHLPYIKPFTWFNDRYGLMMLPAFALAYAYIVSKSKITVYLGAFIIIFQTTFLYYSNNIITIEDAIRGASGNTLDEVGSWIKNNADDGLILVDASKNDALIFTSGIPLKRYVVEGSRRYWEDSIADPTRYIKWVIMKSGDAVNANLRDNSKFLNNYTLVYKDPYAYVYVLDDNRKQPLSIDDLP